MFFSPVDTSESAELSRYVRKGAQSCRRSDSSTPSESSVPLSQRLAANRGTVPLRDLWPFYIFYTNLDVKGNNIFHVSVTSAASGATSGQTLNADVVAMDVSEMEATVDVTRNDINENAQPGTSGNQWYPERDDEDLTGKYLWLVNEKTMQNNQMVFCFYVADEQWLAREEFKQQRVPARRAIALFRTLLLINSLLWMYPDLGTRHDKDTEDIEQALAFHVSNSSAAVILDELSREVPANADAFMYAIEGIALARLEGADLVEEVHIQALERIRVEAFHESLALREADRQFNAMAVETHRRRLVALVSNQVQQTQMNIKEWTPGDTSTSEQVAVEEAGVPQNVNIPADWEPQEEHPLFEIPNDFLQHTTNDGERAPEVPESITSDARDGTMEEFVHSERSDVDSRNTRNRPAEGAQAADDEEAVYVMPRRVKDYRTVEAYDVGEMINCCSACGALHFEAEPRHADRTYLMCCRHGKVS
jgi:hypothetical protein